MISVFTFLSVFTLLGLDIAQEMDKIKHPLIIEIMLFVLFLVIIIIFIYWVLPQLKWYKNLVQRYEIHHGLKKTETDGFTSLIPIQKTIIEKSFPEMHKILDQR
jgi:NhaP-type Na+/H+ or K+/H+ antiporter